MSNSQQAPYMQYQPGYSPTVRPPSNGAAITAVIAGTVAIGIGIFMPIPIVGILLLPFALIPAVVAIICGHIGLRTAARVRVGRGVALTGLILGYITIALAIVTIALAIIFPTSVTDIMLYGV
ncbi:DUF4190 domain-containing protein [Mycetocola zhadangensis]|uniref:DUF4190 domain-containing protein n=1 Tax=Mycetocola zhadangensis TaxID=1164595 RepID=A0A3L7J104_9MICO|nr:DUF4190 domain-containing protein [Mycetocola zhadangensis]RLQ84196.1 DUF4190 domain-containing protein [Mycetocola zhadangensis]